MSRALGSLRETPLGALVRRLHDDGTSGVLRLRKSGPDGQERADFVLRDGFVVGAALYGNGGVTGMADALVSDALCGPDDAEAAVDRAALVCEDAPGALRVGATRVGVSYAMVVECLATRVRTVAERVADWTGSAELVLEGLPRGATDRESAPARAFLLDEGLPPDALFPAPPVAATPPERIPDPAPSVAEVEARAEATERGEPAEPAEPPATADPAEPPEPAERSAAAGALPEFRIPDDMEASVEEPTRVSEPAPEEIVEQATSPFAEDSVEEGTDRSPAAEVTTTIPAARASEPGGGVPAWVARPNDGGHVAPEVDAEPEDATAEEDVAAEAGAEPATEAAAEAAAEPEGDPEPEDDEDVEAADSGNGTSDLSGPGFMEAALMETDSLLDGEVLQVMLEMGHSAAEKAGATGDAGRAQTGDVVVVDDEGQLLQVLVPALRETGLTVHGISGLEAARARLDAIAAAGQRPLLVVDLLIRRADAGGMLGGLDLAEQASRLDPAPPVILLAEMLTDETRTRAEAAGVAVTLPRPMRAELKKDEEKRAGFLAALLASVEEQRPRATWVAADDDSVTNADTPWASESDEGWDVEGIEARAKEVEDLVPDLEIDAQGRNDALWRETMAMLAGSVTRPEILLQVLRFGAEVLHRAVLFTPKKNGTLVGFGQFGVELGPEVDPDEAVRSIRIAPETHGALAQAIEARTAVKGAPGESEGERTLVRALGGVAPDQVFLAPVLCQGKLAAVLYGDTLGSGAAMPDTTNLEVVLGQAGLALDRAALEERVAVLEGGGGRRGT